MKISAVLKTVTIGLVALIAIGGLIGLNLPSQVQFVSTDRVVSASGDKLFPYFNSRDGQQELWIQVWKNWGGKGYHMNIVDLGGPDKGAGMRLGFFPGGTSANSVRSLFDSFARGYGVIEVSEPYDRIVYDIDFKIVRSRRTITFEPVDDARTRISWRETLSTENPYMRYLLLFPDPSISNDFNTVIAALDDLIAAE